MNDELTALQNKSLEKDGYILKLEEELRSLKKSKQKENSMAKALLLSEIASLEIISAREVSEYIEINNDEAQSQQQQLVVDLLEHCEYLMKYASCFMRESSAKIETSSRSESLENGQVELGENWPGRLSFEQSTDLERQSTEGGQPKEFKNMDMEGLKAGLLTTKRRIDELLAERFLSYSDQQGKAFY